MNPADANSAVRVWSEALLRCLMSAVWGLKVTGLENVPAEGPVIMAANHASLIDPPVLAVAVSPRRRPFGVGKKELFKIPLLGWWLRQSGAFPLDRTGDATSAMRAALDVLNKGGSLCIFPEGTRVKSGEKRAPKSGVAFLSRRTGAPVVPVHVLGTAKFPRSFPLEARIGVPITPPTSDDRRESAAYAQNVMDRIYSL